MYKITAILYREGSNPVNWIHYSRHNLSLQACLDLLSQETKPCPGYLRRGVIRLENFKCELLPDK